MKIDFIIGALSGGGAERVMVLLSEYFALKGHEVRILTFRDVEDFYKVQGGVKRVRLTAGKIPNQKIRNLFNLYRYYGKEENRPEVAISFLTTINIVAILACRARKVPVIVSEHNNHLAMESPKWLTKITWQYFYRKANFVTVLTSFDLDFFEKKKANVKVMPNPCSFPLLEKKNPNRDKSILAVGHLNRHQHKGFDNLITLIKPILEAHPDWNLKIVGGGDEGKAFLEEHIKKEGVKRGIEFLGFRNDVRAIMGNTSIFVLPSRWEGLPMVLLEAMSQGMACIAYDCITGPGDMIQDKRNGLLIEDQNMEAMQDGLYTLIENETLRESLGAEAMKSLEAYSMESIYGKWEKLLNEI